MPFKDPEQAKRWKAEHYQSRRLEEAFRKGNYSEDMGVLTLELWAELLCNRAHRRTTESRYKGKPFHRDQNPHDLTPEFLLGLLRAGCPRTGYSWPQDRIIPAHLRPSMDRIDSDRGYTQDNLQLTVHWYNNAKNTYADFDVIEMCRMVVRQADARIAR
jgi:hypothetical protein